MTDSNTLAPTDAERLEFEAWLQPYWSRAQRISGDGDSVYIEDWVQVAWVGWSTARRLPAPASSEPVALASDSGPSLANDPRLCCRSHPHEKQSLHCQLREVAAWLRLHSAAGKTPSADSMRAHAEQVDAVALELRAASAGTEPFGYLVNSLPGGALAFHRLEPSDWLKLACAVIPVFTAAQVQAMLAQGRSKVGQDHFALPPGWQAVPVEPTDEMVEAAWDGDGADYVGEHKRIFNLSVAWRDALAAAPRPAAPSGQAREPLSDEQIVACIKLAGFKTWDSRMWELKRQIEAVYGITAAQKGDGHGAE